MRVSYETPAEMVELIQEIDHRDSIPREEFENANELATKLVLLNRETDSYFLLGSFQEGDRDVLDGIEQRICSHSNKVAYTMDDFADINGITKFLTIGIVSDYIFQIVERDTGGEVLEEGMLVREPIRSSTYIFKRKGKEKERYNWMQSNGVFVMYDDLDRLYEWESEEELVDQVNEVLRNT